jgi:hypothetical protein
MPITFGTVEVIPHPASSEAAPAKTEGGSERSSPQVIDPCDLISPIHLLADRESRVRAH